MPEELAGFRHIYIDKQSPTTLLLLHGTGGDEHDLVSLGEAIDYRANVLSLRGNVLENGMPRFFKRLEEGVFDREDLATRTKELEEFIRQAAEKYRFTLSGLVAVGYSNGANIALYLLATRPAVLRKALLLRPMSAALPEVIADLTGTTIFIGAGQFDPLVPAEDAATLAATLQSHGAAVMVKVVPSAHGLTKEDITYARSFLYDLFQGGLKAA